MARISAKKRKQFEETLAFCGLAAENLPVFTSEIMSFDQENAGFHDEIDGYFSNPYMKNIAVAISRGHGKTNHLAIALPAWAMALDHDIRILLVSSTGELSRKSLGAIIDIVERNPRYRAWAKIIDEKHVGVRPRRRARQNRDENWSADSITIERDVVAMRDATVEAVGLFGPVLSRRSDIIIVDDVCTQENSASEEQRQKVKDYFRQSLLPTLVPGGRVIVIGTPWHEDDLMSELLKDPQFQVKKRLAAIQHESTRRDLWDEWANIHLDESLSPEEQSAKARAFRDEHRAEMDRGVEVLWPERFPYEDLYLKRVADPFSFARMYMCDPTIRPNQKFSEKDIEIALAKGKNLVLQDEERVEFDLDFAAGGLDLAASLEAWADDSALLVLDRVRHGNKALGINDGDYVLRQIHRGKFSPNENRNLTARIGISLTAVRVETNGMQELMYQELRDMGVPVTSFKTGKEKFDPAIGVTALAILFEQHKIILPFDPKDPRTRRLVSQLVNELRAFPDGHTGDSLMAFWFAYSEIRDRIAGRIIIPGNSLPPSPQGPATEAEADREVAIKQELSRSEHAALILLQEVNRSLEPFRLPKELDADLEDFKQQSMREGMKPQDASMLAWHKQSQRHARQIHQEDARRHFYRY
ncbi:MAG: hypothetical protein KGH79_02125 [Patescibacteria group bacterium]|nr:hypothetical protein [Patescibacteria group bacterium]